MSASYFDLLKYAATGIASPDMTYYDRMRASTLMGGVVRTLTGQTPLSFKADGTPLISWSMLGNGEQTGTPTPDNPVMPEFVGTLDDSDWTIPITCAGQTVPVYLGEVPTVRRIRKLVLTGEETVSYPNVNCFRFDVTDYLRDQTNKPYCTHYVGINPVSGVDGVGNKRIAFLVSASGNNYMYIRDTSYSTTASFKQFLAEQYAAGHPVCVWYVLATPETGITNEPLCKIGTYADELSSGDAGVTIPTSKGQNVLTVETELQPSEMTITYKG